jgi:hypothetical protein
MVIPFLSSASLPHFPTSILRHYLPFHPSYYHYPFLISSHLPSPLLLLLPVSTTGTRRNNKRREKSKSDIKIFPHDHDDKG